MDGLPNELEFLRDAASAYGREVVWCSQKESSTDSLKNLDIAALQQIYVKIRTAGRETLLAEWLEKNQPSRPDHNAFWQWVFNLTAVFAELGRRGIAPFCPLKLDRVSAKKGKLETTLPIELRFLIPEMTRFGSIIRDKGELEAQSVFRALSSNEKKKLRSAAKKVRTNALYEAIILPFVGNLQSDEQHSIYGLCGFWDINGIKFECR